MTRITRQKEAGRAYLDLQNRARRERRNTQELLTLYVVERWLARLSGSAYAELFVLKGGMLLATFGARRPTADADALARDMANDEATVVARIVEIAGLAHDDGVEFRTNTVTARTIRDEALYAGVRVTMDAQLATATVRFRIDVNFGDPVTPAPQMINLPALRPDGAPIRILGYRSRPSSPRRSRPRSPSAQPTPEFATTPTSTHSSASTTSNTRPCATRSWRPANSAARPSNHCRRPSKTWPNCDTPPTPPTEHHSE